MSKSKGLIAEFKDFIAQGNAFELAVGIIIGAAFTAIVNSLVNDLIMPIIGIIIGGKDFSGLSVAVGDATIQYGLFVQAIVNFILVALIVFFIVKGMNALRKKKEVAEEAPAADPEELVLLREIRDALNK